MASCLVVGIQTKHEAVPVFPLAGSRLEMRSRGLRLFFFANYRGPKSGCLLRYELLLLRVPCLFVFQRETTQKGKATNFGDPFKHDAPYYSQSKDRIPNQEEIFSRTLDNNSERSRRESARMEPAAHVVHVHSSLPSAAIWQMSAREPDLVQQRYQGETLHDAF